MLHPSIRCPQVESAHTEEVCSLIRELAAGTSAQTGAAFGPKLEVRLAEGCAATLVPWRSWPIHFGMLARLFAFPYPRITFLLFHRSPDPAPTPAVRPPPSAPANPPSPPLPAAARVGAPVRLRSLRRALPDGGEGV